METGVGLNGVIAELGFEPVCQQPSNNKTHFPAVNERSLNIKRQITLHISPASDTLRLKLTVSTCLHRATASEQPEAASQRLRRATLG